MKKTSGIITELIKAILAGFCIGLGGCIFLSVEDKVIGSFLFSVGLFCVCCGKLNLFTGRVCYARPDKPETYIYLPLIIIGNLIGTMICSLPLHLTRNGDKFIEKAALLCDIKSSDNLLSLFILGILCNIFIFIAVHGYMSIEHEIGKYLAIIFGVMGFILCGSEHSVADMFYISMANAWSPDMALRLLVIVLGNSCGGLAAGCLFEYVSMKTTSK